jgi:hypothetical protein
MSEAGIQIFHLGSDVIPAETRGWYRPASPMDRARLRSAVNRPMAEPSGWVPRNDEAGPRFAHDLGGPDFRRDDYRNAAPHAGCHPKATSSTRTNTWLPPTGLIAASDGPVTTTC